MSARPSPAPFKRSIDGLFNVWLNLRSQGHEKPLRNALYNVLVIIVLIAIVGVGFILAPFMKPLLWAFLFGAALFPAKKKLSFNLNKWIEIMDVEDKPIFICILVGPIQGILNLGQYLTGWLLNHLKFLVIAFVFLGTLRLLIWIAPAEVFLAIWNFIVWSNMMFANLLSSLSMYMILVILVTYTLSVYMFWTPDLHSFFMLIGQILWIVVIGYFCSFLSALQVPVFLGVMLYGLLGILYNIKTDDNNDSIIYKCKSLLEIKKFQNLEESKIETEEERVEKLNEIKSKLQLNMQSTPISSRIGDNNGGEPETESFMNSETLDSDVYFKILFYACGITVIWKHTWLIILLLIPVMLHGIKMLAYKLGIVSYAYASIQQYYEKTIEWVQPRHSALLPACLPGVMKINTNLHKLFCSKLKSYIDDISSIVMIGLLIVLVVFISVFSFIQIYSETIAVAQLASNLVNRTLTHKPELIDMLPIDMNSMDDIIDNAYKYGRTNIEMYVDGIFNDTDPVQAKKLKYQILSVWDRLIQSWMDRNNGEHVVGPRVTSQSIIITIDEIFVNTITKAGVIGWVKSNIGMLMEVADSLWLLFRTNISLLASAVGTLFSVILGGGHAVIKFLFHTIIFFTTLFYLLQCSQERYAPVDFNINVSWGQRFAKVFEDSISSVLVATLKLALFHGLFTWLTHTIFGAHVIYLPAVLASILAAAPFLETYWCSVPAFLDLWLSQDRFWLGVTLVLIHFIVPSNFNPIIHSEIKGGSHPYLTCLSIAGGIWLVGLEGTILGPLLLCLLVVLFDVTVCAINDSPSPQTR